MLASPAVLLYLLAITGSCRRVLRLVVMLKDALLAHHACRFPAEDFSHFLHISNDMASSITDRACPSCHVPCTPEDRRSTRSELGL